MRKTAAILLTALCLAAGCDKNNQDEALKINLNTSSVTLSAEEPATVTYSSADANGTVLVSTESAVISISEQSYDSAKQAGTFTLSTTQNKKETLNLELTFKDSKSTAKKTLTVETKSTWSIEPTDPQS